MIYLPIPRIVTPLRRQRWYHGYNWPVIGVVAFCIGFWVLVGWGVSLAVKP